MKIALLLTGQLRTVDMVKYLHMNTLISKYDTDVFISIDLDNSLQRLKMNNTEKTKLEHVQDVINYFNPIDYIINDNFEDEFIKLQEKCRIDITIRKRLFQQYRTVYNAYKLLINHINETNKEYDLIIRLRFDQFIWTNNYYIFKNLKMIDNRIIIYDEENTNKLNEISKDLKLTFDEIEDNTVYVFGFGDYLHYKYANEQFWYHNSKLINIMSKFYDNMLELIVNCSQIINGSECLNEFMFYTFLTNNNINLKKTNISGIFVREFV